MTEENKAQGYNEIENMKIDYQSKLERLHSLLLVMENEHDEVKKGYLIANGKDKGYTDYVTRDLDSFKNLLEIATDLSKITDIPNKR